MKIPLLTIIAALTLLLPLAACTTATRSVTTTFQPSTDGARKEMISMTQSSSVHSLLTTVSGFSDTVTPSGGSHTTIGNYSSDVNAINAIFAGLQSTMGTILIATGHTNQTSSTNFLATARIIPQTQTQ